MAGSKQRHGSSVGAALVTHVRWRCALIQSDVAPTELIEIRVAVARKILLLRSKIVPKRRPPSADRRPPNADRQTPNAKRQTPNAKRQTLHPFTAPDVSP